MAADMQMVTVGMQEDVSWRITKMLSNLCYVHSKLQKDQSMKIVLSDDMDVICDKTDVVKKSGTCFQIFRANGRIVVINAPQVKIVCTIPKERYL